jgi:hypothetical protein
MAVRVVGGGWWYFRFRGSYQTPHNEHPGNPITPFLYRSLESSSVDPRTKKRLLVWESGGSSMLHRFLAFRNGAWKLDGDYPPPHTQE